MGQTLWCLKMFFIFPNVTVSNLLVRVCNLQVSYKLAEGSAVDSIMEYKDLRVQSFIGSRLVSVPKAAGSDVHGKESITV